MVPQVLFSLHGFCLKQNVFVMFILWVKKLCSNHLLRVLMVMSSDVGHFNQDQKKVSHSHTVRMEREKHLPNSSGGNNLTLENPPGLQVAKPYQIVPSLLHTSLISFHPPLSYHLKVTTSPSWKWIPTTLYTCDTR